MSCVLVEEKSFFSQRDSMHSGVTQCSICECRNGSAGNSVGKAVRKKYLGKFFCLV